MKPPIYFFSLFLIFSLFNACSGDDEPEVNVPDETCEEILTLENCLQGKWELHGMCDAGGDIVAEILLNIGTDKNSISIRVKDCSDDCIHNEFDFKTYSGTFEIVDSGSNCQNLSITLDYDVEYCNHGNPPESDVITGIKFTCNGNTLITEGTPYDENGSTSWTKS